MSNVRNVRHLAVFRAVMKTGSVSAAARLLAVSQPAVTKTLQQIEWEIGVPLFRRIKGRLQPTPESMLLIPKVDQVFGAVEEVERLAAEIGGGKVGQVSIATATTLGASIVATAIAEYRTRRPQAIVKVRALATRQVVEEVANNQVDIGLTDAATIEGTLRTEELCKAFIGCVMPKDHPLAEAATVQLSDLKGENLIAFFEDTLIGLQIRQRLGAVDMPSEIPISTNQSLIACVLASKGLGIGLIDPFTPLSGLFPNVVIRPLVPEMEIRPRFVFPPNRPLSIATTEFIQIIRTTFDEKAKSGQLIFELPKPKQKGGPGARNSVSR
ncbi:LysR family transcriptional regulator [Aliidongia dinghuensis]|uniref:LysR family transcriptional regulator n=1 Tax=Aliidongia dinghuensis TaxID=1867774 RepID=A0A8J2Z028_9PROT|nr:LysR family transcriptional regulator [Aliidongia dinghuensis]GGF43045.1 LysR family transcriptional regulator [Aliidongia dinghuensis]